MDKNKSKSAATASRIRFRFPDEAPVGAAIGKFRWLPSGCNLGDLRCWQRRRRVAFVSADPGWVFCECRKENSDAGLRSRGDADRIGVQWPRALAVRLIGLAAAAHQGFSANLFTTASDMFSR